MSILFWLGSTVFGYNTAEASSNQLRAAEFPWSHKLPWETFDHASIRRGFKVFSSVCSTCHGLRQVAFRHLIGPVLTEEEAKEEAAKHEFRGDPDDTGEYTTRNGKITDHIPSPYANEQAARYANNGALPPDLSLIIKARPQGPDYLFSLLTGYHSPPAGVSLREGLHYNPYFPGNAIGMAQALNDGQVDYDDGTTATISQMAKDVTTFLNWAAEPELDVRKSYGIKAFILIALMTPPLVYWKRLKWSVIKSRKLKFMDIDKSMGKHK